MDGVIWFVSCTCIRKKLSVILFHEIWTQRVVIKTLQNAYKTQNPAEGLILHTDLGTQYKSEEFQKGAVIRKC
jgi:hypothetical protein